MLGAYQPKTNSSQGGPICGINLPELTPNAKLNPEAGDPKFSQIPMGIKLVSTPHKTYLPQSTQNLLRQFGPGEVGRNSESWGRSV